MYNSGMAKTKEIHFSQARQKLSVIVDEVEKTGRAVTILRHGKPAAVVVSAAEYQMKFGKKGSWRDPSSFGRASISTGRLRN